DRVGGVRRRLGQAVDGRERGAGAGAEHDGVGRDRLLAAVLAGDVERPVPGEAGGAAQQGEIRVVLVVPAVLLAAGGDRVDAPEDAVADRRPVHVLQLLGETEAGGVGGGVGEIGGVHEHLRGDAPEVQAGAAEDAVGADAAVDLHDAAVGELRARERVRGAGADQGDVVMSRSVHRPRLVGPRRGWSDPGSGRIPAGRWQNVTGAGRSAPRRARGAPPMPSPAHPADSHDVIRVRGAREKNLRDVSLDLPKRRLTVFTGVSGSGKSSLVFSTIAAESQRMINETYSSFLQGFMPSLARPDVDELQGLTTAIIVDQERMGANVRSTVGTATDANAYLRTLFSKLAEPH